MQRETLRWGGDPGLSRWAPHNREDPYKRQAARSESEKEQRHWEQRPEGTEDGPEPRNAGGLRKREKSRP